jgi:hypothetical protein
MIFQANVQGCAKLLGDAADVDNVENMAQVEMTGWTGG